jgi:hypothetical protein
MTPRSLFLLFVVYIFFIKIMLIFHLLCIAKIFPWSDPHLFNPIDGSASGGLAGDDTL